ncbi:MAG: sigma-70 family RNA polymerase sigma factor [Planctomycetes bacterium]|nr:sigma-70 family RNA polymerase sigma factor [Planctomycetota bacterium]
MTDDPGTCAEGANIGLANTLPRSDPDPRAVATSPAQCGLDRFVEEYQPMVLAICRKILPEESAAQDAAQTVWLSFLRKRERLAHHANLGGWLNLAARSTALQQRRNLATQRRHELRNGAASAIVELDSGEALTDQKDLVRLQEALEELPEAQRAAILARYCLGLSRGEAAIALGCPEETVHTRTSRAMRRLRRRLGAAAFVNVLALTDADASDVSIQAAGRFVRLKAGWHTWTGPPARFLSASVLVTSAIVAIYALTPAHPVAQTSHVAAKPREAPSQQPVPTAVERPSLLLGWTFELAAGIEVDEAVDGRSVHAVKISSTVPDAFGRAVFTLPKDAPDAVAIDFDFLILTPYRSPRLMSYVLVNRLPSMPLVSDYSPESYQQNMPDFHWVHVHSVAHASSPTPGGMAWMNSTRVGDHPPYSLPDDGAPRLFVASILNVAILLTEPKISAALGQQDRASESEGHQ